MDLNIHLDSSDTLFSTAYLKVHIAEEVFQTLDPDTVRCAATSPNRYGSERSRPLELCLLAAPNSPVPSDFTALTSVAALFMCQVLLQSTVAHS